MPLNKPRTWAGPPGGEGEGGFGSAPILSAVKNLLTRPPAASPAVRINSDLQPSNEDEGSRTEQWNPAFEHGEETPEAFSSSAPDGCVPS
ncbi:hypothetical protein AAFF_G00108930 [Aldrovandia affinis]|uniref:Uncharacterized protein n=1 Tax=Aldrovandia affinis TaxID=143900 RepID=A0AAD7RTY6_9TELE|nr:hypothetical protein AAFF_G00108930 [Aldrovandia affinis]